MTTTTLTAGDAGTGVTFSGGNDGAMVIKSGPSGAKVNAISIAADGTVTFANAIANGGIGYTKIASTVTLTANSGYLADTSAGSFTVFLPATPAANTQIFIADDGNWATNNLIVNPNGRTVQGQSGNVVMDVAGANVQFLYDGTTWKVYGQFGANTGNNYVVDSFTSTGSSSYTLSTSPGSVNNTDVYVGGVYQLKGVDYSVVGNVLTWIGTVPVAGVLIEIVSGSAIPISVPSNATVGVAQLSATGTPSSSTYLRGDNTWSNVGLTLGTVQNTTSGTSIDFTGIPSWVKRITVMFNGVSLSGSSHLLLQLGTASGVETTGYLGSGISAVNAALSYGLNSTAGFYAHLGLATRTLNGALTISVLNQSSYLWTCAGVLSWSTEAGANMVGGVKQLVNTLDRIRLTTVNGTDTFDAGTVNIMYE